MKILTLLLVLNCMTVVGMQQVHQLAPKASPLAELAAQEGNATISLLPADIEHLDMMQFLIKKENKKVFPGNGETLEALLTLHNSPKLRKFFRNTSDGNFSGNAQLTDIALWVLAYRHELHAYRTKNQSLDDLFLQNKANSPCIMSSDEIKNVISVPWVVYTTFPFMLFYRGHQAGSSNRFVLSFSIQNKISLMVLKEALCLIYNYLKQPGCTTVLAKAAKDQLLIDALKNMIAVYDAPGQLPHDGLIKLLVDLTNMALELEIEVLGQAVIEYCEARALSDYFDAIIDNFSPENCDKLAFKNGLFKLKWLRRKLNTNRQGDMKEVDAFVITITKALLSQKAIDKQLLQNLAYEPIGPRLHKHLLDQCDLDYHEGIERPSLLNGSKVFANFCVGEDHQLLIASHKPDVLSILLMNVKESKCRFRLEVPGHCIKASLIDGRYCVISMQKNIYVFEIRPHDSEPIRLHKKFASESLKAFSSCSLDHYIMADSSGVKRVDGEGQCLMSYSDKNMPIDGIVAHDDLVVGWTTSGIIYIWDDKNACVERKISEAPIHSVGILHDGTIIVGIKGQGIHLLNYNGEVLKSLAQNKIHDTVVSWASFNEFILALGYESGHVLLWDTKAQIVVQVIHPPVLGVIPLSLHIWNGLLSIGYSTGELAKVFLQKFVSTVDLIIRICPQIAPPIDSPKKNTAPLQSLGSNTTDDVMVVCQGTGLEIPESLFRHLQLLGMTQPREIRSINGHTPRSINIAKCLWKYHNMPRLLKDKPRIGIPFATDIIQLAFVHRNSDVPESEFTDGVIGKSRCLKLITISCNGHSIYFDGESIFFHKKGSVISSLKGVSVFSLAVFREMLYITANVAYSRVIKSSEWNDNDEYLNQLLKNALAHYAKIGEFSAKDLILLARECDVAPIAHAALSHLASKKPLKETAADSNEKLSKEIEALTNEMTISLAEYLAKNNENRAILFRCILQKLMKNDSPRSQDGFKEVLDQCATSFVDSLQKLELHDKLDLIAMMRDGKHMSYMSEKCQAELIKKFGITTVRRKITTSDALAIGNHHALMALIWLFLTGQNIARADAIFSLTDKLIALADATGTVTLWNLELQKSPDMIVPEKTSSVSSVTVNHQALFINYADGTSAHNDLNTLL